MGVEEGEKRASSHKHFHLIFSQTNISTSYTHTHKQRTAKRILYFFVASFAIPSIQPQPQHQDHPSSSPLHHSNKMKASLTALLTLLTTTTLALPTALSTLQLANDITGANAIRSVPIGSAPNTLLNVFANTALVKNGALLATSLQNVAPGSSVGVTCTVRNAAGAVVASVNDQKTFAELDGVKDRAVETDVAAFTVACSY